MKSLLSPIFLTFCVPPLGIPQQFASTGTGNFLLSPRRDRPAVWLQMSHFDELDDGAMYLQNSPDPYWLFRTRQSDYGRKCQIRGETLAMAFVASKPEIVDEETGLMQWLGIPQVELAVNVDMLVRKIDVEFWEQCFEYLQTTKNRVCVVGTSGIGKTITTPYLLRHALHKGKNVGYTVRSGLYYVFRPIMSGNELVDVSVEIFPSKFRLNSIKSLNNPDALLVIDRGNTVWNKNPLSDFKGQVVIVSEPDSRNWGGLDFQKKRGDTRGVFMYMPLWTLEEILAVPEEYKRNLSKEAIIDHYRKFGPVFSHVLTAHTESIRWKLSTQNGAMSSLTTSQVEVIAFGRPSPIVNCCKDAPYRPLLGQGLRGNVYDGTHQFFMRGRGVIISDRVSEILARDIIAPLWNRITVDENQCGWKIFESYCRYILVNEVPMQLRCRGISYRNKKRRKISLGGCLRSTPVNTEKKSLVAHALGEQNVLYYSSNSNNHFVSFVYADTDNNIHAIIATTSDTHDSQNSQIRKLADETRMAGNVSSFFLHYFVLDRNFVSFTMPEGRQWTNSSSPLQVLVVKIEKPEEPR